MESRNGPQWPKRPGPGQPPGGQFPAAAPGPANPAPHPRIPSSARRAGVGLRLGRAGAGAHRGHTKGAHPARAPRLWLQSACAAAARVCRELAITAARPSGSRAHPARGRAGETARRDGRGCALRTHMYIRVWPSFCLAFLYYRQLHGRVSVGLTTSSACLG